MLLSLDKMEFPFCFINKLISRYKSSNTVNRYPNNELMSLCKLKVLRFFKLSNNYDVLIGNGSDEIISIIISSSCNNRYIALYRPTFDMYLKYCILYKKKLISISLIRPNFKIRYILSNIIPRCSVIFICYPNNPTGNIFNFSKLLSIIKYNPNTTFVIDEAYFFYSNVTLIKYANIYNVLILRTLSKVGFAGIRIGFLIGSPTNISTFYKKKSPYNIGIYQINIINIFLTSNIIKLINIGIKRILIEKNLLVYLLNKTKIITYLNSYCNFILFRSLESSFKLLFSPFIKLRGIYIFGIYYYRVSIGSRKEMIPFYKDIFRNDRRFRFRKKNKGN
ncbi:histidinol-phosphate aminotransferase family protein [Candidatus Vidania fulgoroideae]|uniref:Histidinol-phosphate aminotransferase family protein n=1 Tax=Candidatus Vidania fulgoroideorum TaxID=881286 RepID=A0A974X9L4_9PROT|nr:histidinol-phosphate aminotransferase family protein [Candidatus Vidania fulgoroideae]